MTPDPQSNTQVPESLLPIIEDGRRAVEPELEKPVSNPPSAYGLSKAVILRVHEPIRSQVLAEVRERLEGLQRFVPKIKTEPIPDGVEYPSIAPHTVGDLLRRKDVLAALSPDVGEECEPCGGRGTLFGSETDGMLRCEACNGTGKKPPAEEYWAICPPQLTAGGLFKKGALEIAGPYSRGHDAGIGKSKEWAWVVVGPVASLTEAMQQRPELFVTPDPYTQKMPEGHDWLDYTALGGTPYNLREQRLREGKKPPAPSGGELRNIDLAEPLSAWGAAKDQLGVMWLTCHGNPILNLTSAFHRAATQPDQHSSVEQVEGGRPTSDEVAAALKDIGQAVTDCRKAVVEDGGCLDPDRAMVPFEELDAEVSKLMVALGLANRNQKGGTNG